jgi:hypothetical protein
MTRAEHLEWAKARAREHLDAGDWADAWASLVSDLGKHEETRGHPAIVLGMTMLASGLNATVAEMREFIEDVR